MKVVIDSNVFISCIGRKSFYRNIIDSLIQGDFDLLFTTEILLEYQEIIESKHGVLTRNAFLDLLLELPNSKVVNVYYNWKLISKDEDVNKYVDCAVAG